MKRSVWKLDTKIDALLVVAGIILAAVTVLAGWDVRTAIAAAAIVLMFAANIPYCVSALQGKTQPHVATWLLLAGITGLAVRKSVQSGGKLWSLLPLLAAAIMNLVNSAVGWKHAKKQMRPTDWVCVAVATVAIVLWATVDQPLLIVVSLTSAGVAAYVPTIAKAWRDPWSEPLRPYYRNTVRYLLITLAISPYSWETLLYPATWIAVNGLFGPMLVIRRKAMPEPTVAKELQTPPSLKSAA